MPKSITACPKEFICPITQKIMSDPIVLSSGTSCERKAAEIWIIRHKNNTDPATGEPLENKIMAPNMDLKNRILKWHAEHKPTLPSSVLSPSLFAGKKISYEQRRWQDGLRDNLYASPRKK